MSVKSELRDSAYRVSFAPSPQSLSYCRNTPALLIPIIMEEGWSLENGAKAKSLGMIPCKILTADGQLPYDTNTLVYEPVKKTPTNEALVTLYEFVRAQEDSWRGISAHYGTATYLYLEGSFDGSIYDTDDFRSILPDYDPDLDK